MQAINELPAQRIPGENKIEKYKKNKNNYTMPKKINVHAYETRLWCVLKHTPHLGLDRALDSKTRLWCVPRVHTTLRTCNRA